MELSDLTEERIRRHVSAEILWRGDEYRRRGAVDPPVKRGDTITAEVEGSDVEPYCVTVRLGEDDIAEASCTCPYEWGGWCKHIAAVLLCAHAPEMVDEEPTPEAILDGLAGLLRRSWSAIPASPTRSRCWPGSLRRPPTRPSPRRPFRRTRL